MKNILSWIKSHIAIVVALIVAVIAVILIVSFATGSEKREIKKYLSAFNSGNAEKIIDVQDLKATIAWDNNFYITDSGEEMSGVEFIKNFDEAISKVTDEEVEEYKSDIRTIYDGSTSIEKVKLLKVMYSTEAVDNKDLKKIVCKVRVSSEPENEIDEPIDTDESAVDDETEEDVIDTEEEAIDEDTEYTEEEIEEMDDEEYLEEDLEEDDDKIAGTPYDSEEDMWKVNKKFTEVTETYATFYLYKGKVIGMEYTF